MHKTQLNTSVLPLAATKFPPCKWGEHGSAKQGKTYNQKTTIPEPHKRKIKRHNHESFNICVKSVAFDSSATHILGKDEMKKQWSPTNYENSTFIYIAN